MSIEDRLSDVELLIKHERHDGALAMLMIAIAASARKVYPRTMKSFDRPGDKMGDAESFKYFLGSRIKSIIQNNSAGPYPRNSSFKIEFRNKILDIESIIYTYCRNFLIHEAVMVPDIKIVKALAQPQLTLSNNGVSISLHCGEKLLLDLGWLDLFKQVVIGARCNNPHTETHEQTLIPNSDFDESLFIEDLNKQWISPNRLQRLKNAVFYIDPANMQNLTDGELRAKFTEVLRAGIIEPDWQRRLADKNIIDDHGVLQELGLELVRKIGKNYSISTGEIEEL